MSCRIHRRHIQALVNGELPADRRDRLRRHLARCDDCRRHLEETRETAALMSRARLPDAPGERMWAGISELLAEDVASSVAEVPAERSRRWRRGVAGLAAVWRSPRRWARPATAAIAMAVTIVALTLGALWIGGWHGLHPHGHDGADGAGTPVVLDVGHYVRTVSRGAADSFWSLYRAESRTLGEPLEGLTFEPVLRSELPGGFRLVEVKLLQEACCKALQLRYRDTDAWLDVFQHPGPHPVEFGDAALEHRQVDGVACLVAHWREQGLAARSFVHGDVNLVLVGRVPSAQLDAMVASLAAGGARGS